MYSSAEAWCATNVRADDDGHSSCEAKRAKALTQIETPWKRGHEHGLTLCPRASDRCSISPAPRDLIVPLFRMRIDTMSPNDWPAVRDIYEAGIATGEATFQTGAPPWDVWDAAHLPTCRLVARDHDNSVIGWAGLARVSARPVYAGVAEVSVYVAEGARGRGIGFQLLTALIDASERDGRWTLQASIFPENEASVGLHERCGFRIVGRRERIARQYGRWRDTFLLERRSSVVGVANE
jgi:L-amino acid N-acyltransferase YncA